jgi:hypothetical protein
MDLKMAGQILKFLDPANIDDVLTHGTIKISTFTYFRSLEGSPGVGDPNEASTIVTVGNAVLRSQTEESLSEPWRPKGFAGAVAASAGATMILENVQTQYLHDDCFIFSASEGERSTLVEAMCRKAKKPYEACVRIMIPLQSLAHRIFWRGLLVEMDYQPVRKFLRSVDFDHVTYDAIEYNHGDGEAPVPSPFRKHSDFRYQSEVRIVLWPAKCLGQSRFTIKLPRPDKIFTEEFRSIPPIG